MKKAERRREMRVVFQTTTMLEFPDVSFNECATHDVSVNGALVAGIKGRKLGDKCKVSLFLRGQSSELQLKMSGEVVRIEKNCIALQFYNVDSDSFAHLKNIVYYNFQHPDETIPSDQYNSPAKPKDKPMEELVDNVEDLDLYVSDNYDNGLPQYNTNTKELVEDK